MHLNLQIIGVLLNTDGMQRKPQYTMAPEIPLVLQSCQFEGLRFICSSGSCTSQIAELFQ